MNHMKQKRKNKKGFTLVELLLSLAIICMIGGVIAGLCASIGSSFGTTYNLNDSADYAALFGKGFENSFLAITQGKGAAKQNWTWYISKPGDSGCTVDVPTLMVQDSKAGTPTPVFHPMFLTKAGTSETKWDIYAFFKKTEQPNAETGEKSIVILYRIFVVDKGNKNFAYRYDGKVWVPRFEERATMNGIKGRKITVLTNSGSGSLPMTPSTFSSIQGTKAYDMIASGLEEEGKATYYSKIQYQWSQ